MDELIELVVKKTGIPRKQAEDAVKVVMDFLKERLPAPLDSQIENLVEGMDNLDLDKGLDMLGGLFGNKNG